MKTIQIFFMLFLCAAFIGMNVRNDQNQEIQDKKNSIESYSKYDFVPGDKVIFFEDFSQEAIGDLPSLWTTDGSGEVRTVNKYPGNWLNATSNEHVYCLMKDLVLPENFIFEFDVIPSPQDEENNEQASFYLTFFKSSGDFLQNDLLPGTGGFHLTATVNDWTADGYTEGDYLVSSTSEIAPVKINELNHIIIWVQDRRLRVYHQGQKVIDGPSALPANTRYNRFRFSMWGQQGHPFFSNLKITTAAPDMRSKLLTGGKIVTYGIYFDVNKDVVKPESYGTLKEIAKILNENPGVRVKILGHTDADGDDAKNMNLSKLRATSVKNELVKSFGIDASRLETDGKGESQPIASNDTPVNKALNRRVEFIKL